MPPAAGWQLKETHGIHGTHPDLIVASAGGGVLAQLPASQHWIVLSTDTLGQLKRQVGEMMLVGITDKVLPASTQSTRSSPTSSFAPSAVTLSDVDASSLRLVDLTAACGIGGHAVSEAGAATGALPGQFLMAARLWGSSQLPKGTALLSPALADCCGGQPAAGVLLVLYRLATVLPTDCSTGSALAAADCVSITLRLCVDHRDVPATQAPPAASTSAAFATSASATPPKGSSSSGKRGSSVRGAGSVMGGAGGGAGGTAAAAGSDWALRLLSQLPPPEERALLCRIALRHLEGRIILPGNVVLLPLFGRQLFFRVQQISGADTSRSRIQPMDPGPFSTAAAGAATAPSAAAAAPAALPPAGAGTSVAPGASTHPTLATVSLANVVERPEPAALVCTASRVELLWPGEAQAGAKESESASPTAIPNSSSNGAADAGAVVAAARAAAAAAVPGSSQEAAMAAAERAVLAGLEGNGDVLLGGVDDHLPVLRDLVTMPLVAPQLFLHYGLRPPRGLLLHGPPGSGKTVLARAAAAAAGAALLVVNGPDVITEFVGESEAGLQGIFAAARALAPAVIFIDEVDALAPARGGGTGAAGGGGGGGGSAARGETAERVVTTLLTLMDGGTSSSTGDVASSSDRVVIIGATNRRAALDGALRRPGRLEREIEIGVPTPAARRDILTARLAGVRHSLLADDIAGLASSAHGFVAADLAALVNEAAMGALRRQVALQAVQAPPSTPAAALAGTLCVTMQDFRLAETRVRPSALREVAVEYPKVSWQDVGGLQAVKQRLQEAVEWPHREPDALARVGAVPPRGVLLYGPPGCSKTLLARAVAHEAGLNFIAIKGGELFSKYVGESERAVAALFSRARASSPSIIFFDEIDALATTRSSGHAAGSTGVGERVLSQLLTEMDGLQTMAGGGGSSKASAVVVVVAATNRPDRVDPALLRPGRFDRLLYIAPPDAAARAEIFTVHLRKTPVSADVDVQRLAAVTEGMTGADAAALCREAALAALDEDLTATQVCWRHFERALALVPPSAPPSCSMLHMYHTFQRSGRV